jgi:TatD DNase family protein
MTFIDSHAHLNAAHFKDNWKDVVTEAKNSGISSIINMGSDLADSEWGVSQAQQEPIVYTTVGVHPEFLTGQLPGMPALINNLRRLVASSSKVVGIGEIGLDYTLDAELAPPQAQHDLIEPQLELALRLGLPVSIHVRDQIGSTDCFNDTLRLIKQFTTSGKPLIGVIHCWTGTVAQASSMLETGFYLSFSGILTYKSAGHITEVAQMVPESKLLIETDAPYLTPEPARSKQHPSVNEPKYVILTAEKLAELRQTDLQTIADSTSANAKRLFRLPATK